MTLRIRSEILEFSRARFIELNKPPVQLFSSTDLISLEELYDRKIPDQYIDLVTNFGALAFDIIGWASIKIITKQGGLENSRFGSIEDISSRKGISLFLDIYGYNESRNLKSLSRFPPDFLPIGCILQRTSGILLINLGNNANGSVWAWEVSHDTWGLGNNTSLGFIAPDIQTMFDSIVADIDRG